MMKSRQPASRTSEIDFLVNMPRDLHGWRIVGTGGYTPGQPGAYASMLVILYSTGKTHGYRFAVARVYWADDRDPNTWPWGEANYDVHCLDAARDLLRERAERGRP
jgi:hypothetical protein